DIDDPDLVIVRAVLTSPQPLPALSEVRSVEVPGRDEEIEWAIADAVFSLENEARIHSVEVGDSEMARHRTVGDVIRGYRGARPPGAGETVEHRDELRDVVSESQRLPVSEDDAVRRFDDYLRASVAVQVVNSDAVVVARADGGCGRFNV